MATTRSVDFLPQIFQTETNKQFLAATLDQLIQEPKFKKTQGFIGRTVGPGVNPNDKYVVEPDAVRANYQLEPGVISLEHDTNNIKNAITYPGINDAVQFNGGNSTRPDRLYASEYYSWDPFVNFDTFINFSQYFWLPNGPAVVEVASLGVPTTDDFVVNRENGDYTFSGLNGKNPVIELVRGGSYTFQVAQNTKETVNYRVTNSGTASYQIDYQPNPALTLSRGNTYVFNISVNGDYPFWIKTEATLGTANAYNNGVSRNGATAGLITFTVPQDAPDTLYYACQTHNNMQGRMNIVDAQAGTGPGFWIQAAPGIDGVMPATPNISSRDVLGVTNNGEDLGLITFNVPLKTAQNFYYSLANYGSVDLICDLKFNQVNGASVTAFNAEYGGIDGITNLNGRTLVFTESATGVEAGGWQKITLDNQTFDIVPADRYQLWQITYVTVSGVSYMTLTQIDTIPNLNKFSALYGNTYSNTQWYKNAAGNLVRTPLLTAVQDTLYYQDGTDPEIFGRIRLLDQTNTSTIDVNEIIGQSSYTSPNGVSFTNGLKVKFVGDVSPAAYGSGSFGLLCTAAQAGTNYLTTASTNNLYVGEQIAFTYPTIGGIEPGIYYVQSIASDGIQFSISSVKYGPPVSLDTVIANTTATVTSDLQYYVSGVGTAIELLPVSDFVTPEGYVVDNNTTTISVEPDSLDYLTISKASRDLNPWTRSNRWFHADVINATAEYNGTVAVFDNNYRAKRPIIEFRPGIRLWNMGTQGKQPVDIIDFAETDAFSNVQGSTGYTVDGYQLIDGSRVIFAADQDADVANKIFVVSFISPDTVSPIIAQPIINLTLASDGEVLADQSTVCLYGNTQAGQTYWFNGIIWAAAQQKTSVQQAPLYDVYDSAGNSFGDQSKYQSSTFVGSPLFSYAVGDTGIVDPVLQFPLQYLNINNVGDIVFENNLYKDTFLYVEDNASVTSDISSGSVREYNSRVAYNREIGWQTAETESQIRQQFKFTYAAATLKLDVRVNDPVANVPSIKLYVGSVFQSPDSYSYTTTADSTTITLNKTYVIGDSIEVAVLSDQTSQVAFYQVPVNLQNNPLNGNSESFTLGTIRTHYESICENLNTVRGTINGANNTRDLGNIVPYGLTILQQSSPMTLAGYFFRSTDYNIFNSLNFNDREYSKFKYQLLDAVTKQDIGFSTVSQILDTAIAEITLGRIETQPFYWSDMLPAGAVYTTTNYTVSLTTTDVFDTVQVYNYASSNYAGMNVYLNNAILTRGIDYVVATDGPRITILAALTVGDQLTLQEYSSTYGTFVPNTPTKLGLYASYVPGIITQQTSNGLAMVIQGHDGSITPMFGDLRDSVLLEFETRIYNNLKHDGNPVPLDIYDVLPGQFRQTGYTYQEISSVFNEDLLNYVGGNKLDYKTQQYTASNEFTWNYSNAKNKLNNENLLGAWRGIYRYFYDTEQPQYTPWEMLGISEKPAWWEIMYGPAPYTSGNTVLWDDLEAGLVRDPIAPYVKPDFVRPGLSQVIPVGDEGQLLSPFDSVVGNYDQTQFQKSWAPGDGGPVEASWWNSSSYPFAVMQLLAVTRPAKFFALFADRDLYRYSEEYQQYLYNQRYRLDANGIEIYGNGVSKASYINWIVDYNRQTGIDSTTELANDLSNLDVRLCYRMASFSDKQYIKLYTEKSSPNSTNTALLIPDESYDLMLYKNQPFDRSVYSAVVVQKVVGGYAVFGYGTSLPYFEILQSKATGLLQTISSGGITVKVPTFYSDTVTQVPYGFIFTNETSVCDFLLSYGQRLERNGLTFTEQTDGYVLTWDQMCQEFLYWSQQGWDTDALLNLNPLAFRLTVTREQAVVDSIKVQTVDNALLDQNRRELNTRNLNIVRVGNTFSCEPLTDQTLSFIDLKFTTYEHMIVLNNQSVFGDLIYAPITGARQSRLNLVCVNSTDWTGQVNAPGFILNQDNVQEWTGLRTYSKGEIVKYKNVYWSALSIVQPSTKFNFNEWTQSDYTQSELGLLPNLANKADQLVNTYNINSANIETDNDLLAYGLIGFRPREYMAALNLDDVSQVNVYRQLLGSKGTILSAELFAGASLGKETADYSIYENWAVERAVYGANANRSFFELKLNKAQLNSNPSLVQVILPGQTSQADQAIMLSNVWRQSYKLTTPDILPTTTEPVTDAALPTAGYVNVDDVDITVFDVNDLADLNANLDQIGVGASVWVAKVNNYDWNIYRVQSVPGAIQHVCDNLDGTSRVIFSQQHNLVTGDPLIIKFMDVEVDGVYEVIGAPSLDTVNIAFQFAAGRTVINGTGLGFTLDTMRVAQASDVVNLSYAKEIPPGARVWIDNNGNNSWQVIEKREVFGDVSQIGPMIVGSAQRFGSAVAQATARIATLVGSPNYDGNTAAAQGAVYVYVKNYDAQYTPVSPVNDADGIITLDIDGARGLGNSIDFGSQTWAVAGASASWGPAGVSETNSGYAAVIYRDPALGEPGVNPYAAWQLLTQPGTTPLSNPGAGEFGHSVGMSTDERWMYIGAPGLNKVHAYGRVDWEKQVVKYFGDGSTTDFAINQAIQINADTQLSVTIAGQVQTLGADYTVTLDGGVYTTVVFTTPPADGQLVNITRIYVKQLVAGPSVFNLSSLFFTIDSIYSFSITVDGVVYRPNIDYTYDVGTGNLTFANVPSVGSVLLCNAQGYFEYAGTITLAGSIERFGHSVSCSTDGRQVMIGAPNSTVSGKVEAGAVYVYDRDVQRFIADGTTNTFTLLGTVTGPVSVILNNVFLVNQDNSLVGGSNTFVWDGANSITINSTVSIGDVIEVETNQFSQIQVVTQDTVAEFSNFGQSVDLCEYNCSLYSGAPQSSVQIHKGGIVERNVNQGRVYGTITAATANPALTAGHTLRVNNMDVAVPTAPNNTISGLAAAINNAVPNVSAVVSSTGYLTISVKNNDAAQALNRLQVSPGSVGTAFTTLAFDTFAYTQTITSPYPVVFAGFGSSISIDDSATSLAVGAVNGTLFQITIFDDGTTDFDIGSTSFFSTVFQSGAVYLYDYLPSANMSVSNPGNFVFGQQISNSVVRTYDQFGLGLSYTSGVLVVGAPYHDVVGSNVESGQIFVFENASRSPAWAVVREQKPVVDIRLLNSVFTYDSVTSATTQFFDFFDPLQGKILGAAKQNIDYISGIDPAAYNVGQSNINGTTWAAEHVGQMWWDTSTVRFIDPNQDDIVYASRRWGQVFPGSSVNVYQWVMSPVPPALYTGPGTPLNNLSYTINSRLGRGGVFATEYYFWVQGITTTATKQGKTLSADTVAQYIENPRASGISYLAPINASTFALYNALDYIEAADTVLNIEFDREFTTNNVHVEYELIAQDKADAFLSDNLYRKMQDSFCGVDTFGNLVPDPNLSIAERYGVQFRPRQSMFVDRLAALKNYLTRANNVMALYPISEIRSFALLNSAEPAPTDTSGKWDLRVANLEILGFQNIYAVALGYKYLVVSDSNNRGLWTIYTVESDDQNPGSRKLVLTGVQGYNTADYWRYVNWYRPGYNSSSKVVAEVANIAALEILSVPVGSSARITANSQGKFEIYLLEDTGWSRVGLENGTIEFSAELWDYAIGRFGFDIEVFDAQYYDQEPVIETRKIIQAINQELFIDDLAIERNRALTLVFDFVLSEFSAPEWLVKTSLIDVDHRIRDLVPYQNYRKDNQEFVLDYIQEVKPYHVQIREFNLRYNGSDEFMGSLTDFDLPAFYDTSLEVPQYTSPVLLPYLHSAAQVSNVESDTSADSQLWSTFPYNQWYNNRLLNVISIDLITGRQGSGYTEPPLVVITGSAVEPAEAIAVINSLGQVVGVEVTNPGSGYSATPTVTFEGGNGSGAQAIVRVENATVRSFKTTIKFDRLQYQTSVQTWTPDVSYQDGQLVRYVDRVWQAASSDSTAVQSSTFDLADWIEVDSASLSGVDRTMGLYVPNVNQPGLELPLLIDGVDYPGVQVYGDYFLGNPANTDTVIESAFSDTTLSNRISSVNIDGGDFVGVYEGHAPEELVNGAEYDTLDMKVYTRPGSDWTFDGHGFQIGTVRYTYEPAVITDYSWSGLVDYPVQIVVSNQTTGRMLSQSIDFDINWAEQTVEFLNSNVVAGHVVAISAYETGGGSQLYRANYIGSQITDSVVIPVGANQIQNVAVFENSTAVGGITWTPYINSTDWNLLTAYSKLDVVNNSNIYYRALQEVPVGVEITNVAYWQSFVPAQQSLVNFGTTFAASSGIALVAFGVSETVYTADSLETNQTYRINTVGTTDFTLAGALSNTIGTEFTATGPVAGTGTVTIAYSWSTPQIDIFVADADIVSSRTLDLDISVSGTNPANIIVNKNGLRLRPAGGIEHTGNGALVQFGLPTRSGFSQQLIYAPTDIDVWVNGVLQVQSVGLVTGSYSVSVWDGTESRQVIFNTAPAAGDRVLISVSTLADYRVAANTIELTGIVNLGDVFQVIGLNDTQQQNALTLVFQGPVTTGITLIEPYDSTTYSVGTVNLDPGSYDYSQGIAIPVNDFWLQRPNVDAARLWVTLNGVRLYEGQDYTVSGEYLVLSAGAIRSIDILVVTQVTNFVVPEAIAFRIFQDMRGVQATYRITTETSTQLSQPMTATANIAYVVNAAALSEPDLPNGVFGLVTIGGERIMYRERNTALNFVQGLMRGTAGTGASDHATGTAVYDISRGNLLNQEYQDYVDSDTSIGDGITTVFRAPSVTINTTLEDSSFDVRSVEVYVGGTRQYAVDDTTVAIESGQYRWAVAEFDPLAIEFVTQTSYPDLYAPPAGAEVTILVRKGLSWYQIGNGTASNGIALQETDTVAARFLKGQ
jgi:hypothetical protein